MSANVGTRLSTATPYIRDLNIQIRKGEIKIPQFQRPFVWGDEQALKLLDSVANNYPIGSLLLWRTSEKLAVERNLGQFLLPETDDLSPTEYVLDGQQRLTVLYSSLGAEPDGTGFAALYDLERERFVSARNVDPAIHLFPMRSLYQTTRLLNFRTALQTHPKASVLQDRFDNMVEVFTGYQIPVVTLKDLTVEEVCPIFERVNSSGTPLSIFDLMVAATWSNRFDLNATVEDIALALKPKNYGDIRGTTVLKCLAAIRDDSTNRERILSLRQLREKPDDMDSLVKTTTRALQRAVDQLVTDFKMYSLDFLPYEAHLVILTYIYAKNTNLSAEQVRRVRQWFWLTSFAERYRGAPDDFVTRDLDAVQKFVLTGKPKVDHFGTVPSLDTLKGMIFRKNNSRSRAFILTLAKQHPRNLTNGNTIDTTVALSVYNKKQFHHIFPEAFLKRLDPKLERSYVLNFCMLAASENNLVSDDDPQDYLPEVANDLGDNADEVFLSNLLPLPSQYDYARTTLDEFIEVRAEIVHSAIKRLCTGRH
ncbi:GmrSD restriction endonuclease domain-containing protein [Actinosynnema sp. NPDC004786]